MNVTIPKGEVEGWLSGASPVALHVAGCRPGPVADDEDEDTAAGAEPAPGSSGAASVPA